MSNLRRTALALLSVGVTGIVMSACTPKSQFGRGGDPPPIIVADGSIKLTAQGSESWADDNNGDYVEPNMASGSSTLTVNIDADGKCFNVTGASFDTTKLTLIGQDGSNTEKYDVKIDQTMGVIVRQGGHGHKAAGKQVDLGTDSTTWALTGLTAPGNIFCSFGPNPQITLTPK
jgi:hypothetical protein